LARALGRCVNAGDDTVAMPLKALLEGKEKTPVPALLRAEALHALAAIDGDAAQAAAKELLEDQCRAAQIEAIRVLGMTLKGAKVVRQQAAKPEFPRDLLPHVLEVLNRHAEKD